MTALPSWNDTATRAAIESYVESATGDRVAVFDNDGTLWCEKPMPIQLDFILRRWGAMAEEDAALRREQPFKAAYEHDHAWLGAAMTKHYEGDDGDLKLIMGGVSRAFAGMSVDEYMRRGARVLRRRAAPDARPSLPRVRASGRWSSCSATSRRTDSARSSPRAATATSCARSRSRCTASRPSA